MGGGDGWRWEEEKKQARKGKGRMVETVSAGVKATSDKEKGCG